MLACYICGKPGNTFACFDCVPYGSKNAGEKFLDKMIESKKKLTPTPLEDLKLIKEAFDFLVEIAPIPNKDLKESVKCNLQWNGQNIDEAFKRLEKTVLMDGQVSSDEVEK